MAWLATLAQAKQEQIVPNTDLSGDVALSEILAQITSRIHLDTHRNFLPSKRLRSFHAYPPQLRNGVLSFGDLTLLEIDELTLEGSPLTLDEDYYFSEVEPPYSTLEFAVSHLVTNARAAIQVSGIWGYHQDYDNAWQRSTTTLNANMNSSITTLAASATAFSPGARLRIGSEYIDVLTTYGAVKRGAGGSTATAHTSGAAIDVWTPELPITRAALRWAAFLYHRRGHYSPVQIDAVVGTVISRFPPDMPEEVQNILKLYAPYNFGVV